ncbi:MAG: carboxymuconolactone decarboxylase family protein [Candidatus Acidiferrales bacterium]|jgi:4-carboxymuconolactone decarboxylase
MRLDPIPPKNLSSEQRPLFDRIQAGIEAHLKGFISKRADGALIGPFNAMLHFPQFGTANWDYITALMEHSTLPKPAHEVAILVVGAHYSSRYELYAHEHVAARSGLSDAKIATIVAGERPVDLTREESIAYDVASKLARGGQLPEATYQAALSAFGEQGTAELVHLIAGYCLTSVILNAYDVSVPGAEESSG